MAGWGFGLRDEGLWHSINHRFHTWAGALLGEVSVSRCGTGAMGADPQCSEEAPQEWPAGSGAWSWVHRVTFGAASPSAECLGSSEAGSPSSALDALGLLRAVALGPFMEEGRKRWESSSF